MTFNFDVAKCENVSWFSFCFYLSGKLSPIESCVICVYGPLCYCWIFISLFLEIAIRASRLQSVHISGGGGGGGGAFQKTQLSSQIEKLLKYTSFNVWARYFVWNFKGYLWNSTQNILPIHWKIQLVHNVEILRACRFKSSYMLLKHPEDMMCSKQALWISNYIPQDTMGTIIYPCSRYVLVMHKSIYVDMWEVTRPWGHGHIRMMVKLCNVWAL